MKAINMFNARTGEIRPITPGIVKDFGWLTIGNGWQPQYNINNKYMGFKDNFGEFRTMR